MVGIELKGGSVSDVIIIPFQDNCCTDLCLKSKAVWSLTLFQLSTPHHNH